MKKLAPYTAREDARGKLIGLMNEGTWEEFNYMETCAGQVRGNHYHEHTLEAFFIIDGDIDVVIVQPNGVEINEHLAAGDIVLIEPGEMHTFYCRSDTRWINFLSKRYDAKNPDMHMNINKFTNETV